MSSVVLSRLLERHCFAVDVAVCLWRLRMGLPPLVPHELGGMRSMLPRIERCSARRLFAGALACAA